MGGDSITSAHQLTMSGERQATTVYNSAPPFQPKLPPILYSSVRGLSAGSGNARNGMPTVRTARRRLAQPYQKDARRCSRNRPSADRNDLGDHIISVPRLENNSPIRDTSSNLNEFELVPPLPRVPAATQTVATFGPQSHWSAEISSAIGFG